MKTTICALALYSLASTAYAQSVPAVAPAPPAAPATIVPLVAPAGTAVLRTGTEVPLKLSEELTTKNKVARVGQRFHMTVAEDIKVNGQTVIPVGSPAMGEVTEVRNKGMWGKSGHLTAQILFVEVNGRQIRLTGTFDDKGVTGTAAVVAAVAFVPVVGFFTTGTSANIPAGSGVKGFIGEDVPLAFTVTAPAPLAVPVPATPLAVPVAATAPPLAAPVATEAAAAK